MDISGKLDIYNKHKKFKDLKFGEVFYFVNQSLKDSSDIRIYIRGGHTDTSKTAMNLETGIMYSFDEYEPVKVISAYLQIENENE